MLKVVLRDVGRQGILSDDKYTWLLENLNKPLTVTSIDLDYDTGEVLFLVIRRSSGTEDADIVVVFIDSNAAKYEFVGELPMRNF